MDAAGFVWVEVRADLGPLDKGLDQAKRKTSGFDRAASGSFRNAGESAKKFGNDATGAARQAANANQQVTRSANAVGAAYRTAMTAVRSFAVAAASAFTVNAIVGSAREFSRAIGEVSTLLPELGANMEQIEGRSREFAKTFGTDASAQAKAFYQTISAGITDVGKASDLLATANKLAIGGVTELVTATDLLTTSMNAYASTGLTAANASDAIFTAVRAGKTTVSELGSSMGQVIPLASALGVSFDELAAGVAALTTQGIATSQAVTALRGVLAAVAKPTADAQKEATRLGIAFDVAALKSKGLGGFLTEIVQKSGGSADSLAKLFGQIEGLNAVLAFSGGAGEQFNAIMDQMADKAGATEEAFDRMASTFDQRMKRLTAVAADLGLSMGNALLTVLVPALELAADNAGMLTAALAYLAAVQIWPMMLKAATALKTFASGMTLATLATKGLAAAMALINWPIVIAGAFGMAIWKVVEAQHEAEKSAIAYAEAQEIVNKALNESVDASDHVIDNTIKKAQANVDAARAALQYAEAIYKAIEAEYLMQSPDDLGRGDSERVRRLNEQTAAIKDHEKNLNSLELTLQGLTLGQAAAADAVASRIEGASLLFDLAEKSFAEVGSGMGSIGTAMGKIETGSASAVRSLENVHQAAAQANRARLSELTEMSAQLRATETEIDRVASALEQASSRESLTKFFGDLSATSASAAEEAVHSIGRIFAELERGTTTADKAHAAIEAIRSSLINQGLGEGAVSKFIDALVRAQLMFDGLIDRSKNLREAINQIPDRTINITIREHTVKTSDGGMTGITVHRGGGYGGLAQPGYSGEGFNTYNLGDVPNGLRWHSPSEQAAMTESQYLNTFGSAKPGNLSTMPSSNMIPNPYFADGGMITGPGGPRDDLVPIMASNGEFIVNADAAAKYRSLLEAINSGNIQMPGFANGGSVGGELASVMGGRNVLAAIEGSTHQTVEEVRRSIGYLETISSDMTVLVATSKGMATTLASLRTAGGSSGGMGGGSSAGGGFGASGGAAFSYHDPKAPYHFNSNRAALNIGGAGYDPVADFIYNGNQSALSKIASSPYSPYEATPMNNPFYIDRASFTTNADIARGLAGFNSGGIIHPGDTQHVEFFKRPDEGVIIYRKDQMEDRTSEPAQKSGDTNNNIEVHINMPVTGDPMSRQSALALRDEVRAAVHDAIQGVR